MPAASMRRAAVAVVATSGACTSFASVRSAEVRSGAGANLVASVSGRVSSDAGWFYSLDCTDDCGRMVAGADVQANYGWRRGVAGRPSTLAAGTSGLFPYVEGYVQLGRGRVPYGVGARAGLPFPFARWAEHQLYGRVDLPLAPDMRLLLNPGLFVHRGTSPNGENRGSFAAFVQGVGLEVGTGRVTVTPAVALVAGRAGRTSYGHRIGPTATVFPTASLGVALRRAAR